MKELINIVDVIMTDSYNRERLVNDLQIRIQNHIHSAPKECDELLNKLAKDLDSYEPESAEAGYADYYGDDKLLNIIEKAISDLKKYE